MLRANLAVAYARPEPLSEATLMRYRDLLLAPSVRAAMLARMGTTVLHDPAPILARIQPPTLLLWGERDRMIPIANAADYLQDLPHAQLVRLPNLGLCRSRKTRRDRSNRSSGSCPPDAVTE